MFARRFESTSHGISYPYLYLNSAASPLARVTDALASAIEPVMTQPTDGERVKMYVTEAGSSSLSCHVQSHQHITLLYPKPLELSKRTGTFFCDITTAQSFPLIPTVVIFAAVIALKAYSVFVHKVSELAPAF